jgi:hypothetical protein
VLHTTGIQHRFVVCSLYQVVYSSLVVWFVVLY